MKPIEFHRDGKLTKLILSDSDGNEILTAITHSNQGELQLLVRDRSTPDMTLTVRAQLTAQQAAALWRLAGGAVRAKEEEGKLKLLWHELHHWHQWRKETAPDYAASGGAAHTQRILDATKEILL